MKTYNTQYIRTLSDTQIETAFIILGVFFNKNDYLRNPSEGFEILSKEGMQSLSDLEVMFGDDFTVGQIKELLKVEMLKRGIQ